MVYINENNFFRMNHGLSVESMYSSTVLMLVQLLSIYCKTMSWTGTQIQSHLVEALHPLWLTMEGRMYCRLCSSIHLRGLVNETTFSTLKYLPWRQTSSCFWPKEPFQSWRSIVHIDPSLEVSLPHWTPHALFWTIWVNGPYPHICFMIHVFWNHWSSESSYCIFL